MELLGKKIFITGGAGFIANSLIARLIDHNKITVFDNFSRDTLSHSPLSKRTDLVVVRGDVLNYEQLLESMSGSSVVVHAAAIAGVDTVLKNTVKTMNVNIVGTANVLEAAAKHKVSDRFVGFSTSEVFGSMAFKPTEEAVTVSGSAGEARWTYAVSKLAGEHMSMAYYRERDLPVVCVRPFNVYGPGQIGEGAIQVFIRQALKNEDIHIHGDGSQIRAWCFIDDFVDCLICCLENPRAIGESFNIGNARTVTTTYGLAQTVCRVLGSQSRILFKPALSAEIELRIPSVEKATQVLGFQAKVDLDEGILRTAEWYRGRDLSN